MHKFSAELEEQRSPRYQAMLGVKNRLAKIDEQDLDVFIPALTNTEMPFREEIISFLAEEGWRLAHWSVAGVGSAVYAYPLFERIVRRK